MSIWLGNVRIDGTEWYGSGSVTLEVTKSGTTYSIAIGVDVDAIIEDVFDFNYFNSGPIGYGPEDGASIQCGWGQPGAITGTHSQAGHMGLVRIDVDGTCSAGPFDDKTP